MKVRGLRVLHQLRHGRAARAAISAAAGQGLGYVIRLGSTLILTRLLTPADYGVLSIVFAVGVIVELISDMGIRACVIRSDAGEDPTFLDTAWTVQVTRGLALAGLTLLTGMALSLVQRFEWLALPSDSALASPLLPWLIMANAASPAILGLTPTKAYTANRQLLMSKLIAIDVLAQVLSVVLTVVVAYVSRSVWSAVIGAVFACALRVLLSQTWIPGRNDRFFIDPSALKELLGFGRWVLISSSLTALAFNGDRFMLGYWYDAATIGQYAIALGFVTLVPQLTGKVVGAVAFPRISQAKRESQQEFERTVGIARRMYDVISMTSAGALFTCGPLVVHLLYDDRYVSAGWMLSVLSCSLILARGELYNSIYFTLGQTKLLPIFSGIALLTLFILVPWGHHLAGLKGAIWVMGLRHLLVLPVHYYFLSKHHLNRFQDDAVAVLYWVLGALIGLGFSVVLQ